MAFQSIILGGMRSRGSDSFGSGQYGAPRGSHIHKGIDVIVKKGQDIYSPIDGDVIRESFPYANDASVRGVLIRGSGEFSGWQVKIFYIEGLFSGPVKAGGIVGRAQSLQGKYPGITDHVHLEISKNGHNVDPREAFNNCF